jgi:hypothetical protein
LGIIRVIDIIVVVNVIVAVAIAIAQLEIVLARGEDLLKPHELHETGAKGSSKVEVCLKDVVEDGALRELKELFQLSSARLFELDELGSEGEEAVGLGDVENLEIVERLEAAGHGQEFHDELIGRHLES